MNARPNPSATPIETAVLRELAHHRVVQGEPSVSAEQLASQLEEPTSRVVETLTALTERELVDRAFDGSLALTGTGLELLESTDGGSETVREAYERVRLTGTVTTGMGNGEHFVSLPGYARQFSERLGYVPFPGTLNLALSERSVDRRRHVDGVKPIPIEEWSDGDVTYGAATCHPVALATASGASWRDAHVIVPDRTDHDERELELVAPVRLRDRLDLADGDELEVRFESPDPPAGTGDRPER